MLTIPHESQEMHICEEIYLQIYYCSVSQVPRANGVHYAVLCSLIRCTRLMCQLSLVLHHMFFNFTHIALLVSVSYFFLSF